MNTKQKTGTQLLPLNARVPPSLVTLWALATEDVTQPAPDEVLQLAEKIRQWVETDDARTVMNRTFATIRTRSPQKITSIISWLEQPDVRDLFSRSGAYGARIKLHTALNSIIAGQTAHAAFGMDENTGRPPLPGFSRAFDAAIYAEYKIRNANHTPTDAVFNAAEIFGARKELVEKCRAELPPMRDADIQDMADHSCLKYGVTL